MVMGTANHLTKCAEVQDASIAHPRRVMSLETPRFLKASALSSDTRIVHGCVSRQLKGGVLVFS